MNLRVLLFADASYLDAARELAAAVPSGRARVISRLTESLSELRLLTQYKAVEPFVAVALDAEDEVRLRLTRPMPVDRFVGLLRRASCETTTERAN